MLDKQLGGAVGTGDMRTEKLQWDHQVLPSFLVNIESGLYSKNLLIQMTMFKTDIIAFLEK